MTQCRGRTRQVNGLANEPDIEVRKRRENKNQETEQVRVCFQVRELTNIHELSV